MGVLKKNNGFVDGVSFVEENTTNPSYNFTLKMLSFKFNCFKTFKRTVYIHAQYIRAHPTSHLFTLYSDYLSNMYVKKCKK